MGCIETCIGSEQPEHGLVVVPDGSEVELHCNVLLIVSLCKGKDEPDMELCKAFNRETKEGLKMQKYSELLGTAISSIITVKEESDIESFLGGCREELFTKEIRGLDDFELICFLVVR